MKPHQQSMDTRARGRRTCTGLNPMVLVSIYQVGIQQRRLNYVGMYFQFRVGQWTVVVIAKFVHFPKDLVYHFFIVMSHMHMSSVCILWWSYSSLPVFFLWFFVIRLGGTTKTYPEANSSGCWMKALKEDENGFKWRKMVKMDDFLATRMFFLGPNFAKNRLEVKKIRLLAKFR
jgi:hypothetical protein